MRHRLLSLSRFFYVRRPPRTLNARLPRSAMRPPGSRSAQHPASEWVCGQDLRRSIRRSIVIERSEPRPSSQRPEEASSLIC